MYVYIHTRTDLVGGLLVKDPARLVLHHDRTDGHALLCECVCA